MLLAILALAQCAGAALLSTTLTLPQQAPLQSESSALLSITLTLPQQAPLQSGSILRMDYTATFTPGTSASNVSAVRLFPYFDGQQYGAEVGLFSFEAGSGTGTGQASVPLPWARTPPTTLQLAWQGGPGDGPTHGAAPPPGAVLSNAAALAVAPRAPVRVVPPPSNGSSLMTLYLETWFTPRNFYWGTAPGGPPGAGLAEAIPAIGRYASVGLAAMRAQAAQFVAAGVDALTLDWTNNCWLPGCDAWEHRSQGIQELVNATDLALGVYAGLRAEGWAVPRFIPLLGLNNGPSTPLPALLAELDYIATAYLGNATAGGVDSLVLLDGRPLVLIFDGSGADHSAFTHPAFTLRWMASQLQSSPSFAARGYWSWMDGTLQPLITRGTDGNPAEAATIAPAFFAAGGWLNAAAAVGRSGGLSLLAALSHVLGATGAGPAAPSALAFLNVCQWNEYAGAPQGPPGTTYTDSYSPDLSNDLEPTSPWAQGYTRPGGVRAGGGNGYSGLNALALARALLANASAADGSAAVFILTPAAGVLASSSATPGIAGNTSTVTVSWVVARFAAAGLRSGAGLLANVSAPVALAVDGQPVAQLPAPEAPGPQVWQLDVSALDPHFPHVLTVTVLPAGSGGSGGGHLTHWPLAFDALDADAAGGLPLREAVPASATAWLWLPQSQV